MTNEELNEAMKILAKSDRYLCDCLLELLEQKDEEIERLNDRIDWIYETMSDI